MIHLRLVKALVSQPNLGLDRFRQFVAANPNPFVTTRAEDVIRSAIADESLFFVVDDADAVVATTGFYRHGHDHSWGELGSTLVARAYQGVGLQSLMYRHIVALKKLSDWPEEVFAVVSQDAIPSIRNIERCGFQQLSRIPDSLIDSTPNHNWAPVTRNLKRLYLLPPQGVAECLLYVADHGPRPIISDKKGSAKFQLSVEFVYLEDPEATTALKEVARSLLERKSREL